MSANLEYAADRYGSGSGWSWDVAKASKGKMTDMIEAQRQAWDEVVDSRVAELAPIRFTPRVRQDARRWAMCKAQADRIHDIVHHTLPRVVEVQDTASLVHRMLGRWIAGTLSGAGRVLTRVGPQDYLEYARGLCGALMGSVVEMPDSVEDGMPLMVKYRFADGSSATIWAE